MLSHTETDIDTDTHTHLNTANLLSCLKDSHARIHGDREQESLCLVPVTETVSNTFHKQLQPLLPGCHGYGHTAESFSMVDTRPHQHSLPEK